MVKAVLFDFDDTLVVTKKVRYEALKDFGKTFYNLTITDSILDSLWGQPFEMFMNNLVSNRDSFENMKKNYYSIISNYPLIKIPRTNRILNNLGTKYLLGIVTSGTPELLKIGMRNVGMDPNWFCFIQNSEDTSVHKPDPKVFEPSLEKLKLRGMSSENVVYVGDAIDDFIAASGAGLHFVAIANRTVSEDVLLEKKIPFINNIEKLPDYIHHLRN